MKYDIIFIIANDAIDAKAMTGKTYSPEDTVCVIMDNKDNTYVGFSNTDLKEGKLITGCSEKEAAKNMLADNSSHAAAVITVNCTARTPVLPCQECVSMILEMNEENAKTLLITPDKTYIKLTDADKYKPGEDNSALEADDVIGETDPLVIATPMNGNGLVKSLNLNQSDEEAEENTVPFYHEPIHREAATISSQNSTDPESDPVQEIDTSLKTKSLMLHSREMIQQEDPAPVPPQYSNSQYMQYPNNASYYNPQYSQPVQQYSQPVNGQYMQQPVNPQYANQQYSSQAYYPSNGQYMQQPANPQFNNSQYSQQYSSPASYQMNGQYMPQQTNSKYINSQYRNNSNYINNQYMQQYTNSGNYQSANTSAYINSPYMNMSQNYMQPSMMQSQYSQSNMNGSYYSQAPSQRFIPNTNTDDDDDDDDLIQGKLDQLLGGKR